jgi:putative DeoR family transcriptional regulator (stage III sporulation protein D)
VIILKNYIEKRAEILGKYIIDNNSTVRNAANVFEISKSTIHKDITVRLKHIDPDIYEKVRVVLDINKKERHLRGGMATKLKYKCTK